MKSLEIRGQSFDWGRRTYVMGILNATPDSFSDGGQFNALPNALAQARNLMSGGVDILDVGGQSTRPGAEIISLEEELNRVIPLIEALRQETEIPLSIDTTRSAVAEAALRAGADIINDVSGATEDPAMAQIAAQYQAPICLMHRRGTPATMQTLTDYGDLVGEIQEFLTAQAALLQSLGLAPEKIWLDPGLGFAKTAEQSLTLMRELGAFKSLGFPLLLGPSRKSFIGQILGESDPQKRVWGTAAVCCRAVADGVDILRVHDGAEMVQVCRLADALWR
ncbi:MAG: dihydropteroate synthase [Cyanobacteria bacterium RI_101]|nr:dihydropteroate synthase [Cyanobacteria bacterium RI_101]